MASQKLTSVDDDPHVLEINSYVRVTILTRTPGMGIQCQVKNLY